MAAPSALEIAREIVAVWWVSQGGIWPASQGTPVEFGLSALVGRFAAALHAERERADRAERELDLLLAAHVKTARQATGAPKDSDSSTDY